MDRVFDFYSPDGWRGINDVLDSNLIIYVKQGEMEVFCDHTQREPICAGSFHLLPKGSQKYIFCDVETISVRIRFHSEQSLDEMNGIMPPSAQAMLEQLQLLTGYPNANHETKRHLLSAIINEILKPSLPALNQHEYDRNQIYAQWIKQALRGESNVNQIAKELDISPDHFARLFKKQYGQTPKAYIMEQRFQQAITILSEENISTTALAKRVGVHDSALFCKQFKQRFGCSPKTYPK